MIYITSHKTEEQAKLAAEDPNVILTPPQVKEILRELQNLRAFYVRTTAEKLDQEPHQP